VSCDYTVTEKRNERHSHAQMIRAGTRSNNAQQDLRSVREGRDRPTRSKTCEA